MNDGAEAASGEQLQRLPKLRSELRFLGLRKAFSGETVGIVYDPLMHRFHQFQSIGYQLLERWSAGTVQGLLERLHNETVWRKNSSDIKAFIEYLDKQQLVVKSRTTVELSKKNTRATLSEAVFRLFSFALDYLILRLSATNLH